MTEAQGNVLIAAVGVLVGVTLWRCSILAKNQRHLWCGLLLLLFVPSPSRAQGFFQTSLHMLKPTWLEVHCTEIAGQDELTFEWRGAWTYDEPAAEGFGLTLHVVGWGVSYSQTTEIDTFEEEGSHTINIYEFLPGVYQTYISQRNPDGEGRRYSQSRYILILSDGCSTPLEPDDGAVCVNGTDVGECGAYSSGHECPGGCGSAGVYVTPLGLGSFSPGTYTWSLDARRASAGVCGNTYVIAFYPRSGGECCQGGAGLPCNPSANQCFAVRGTPGLINITISVWVEEDEAWYVEQEWVGLLLQYSDVGASWVTTNWTPYYPGTYRICAEAVSNLPYVFCNRASGGGNAIPWEWGNGRCGGGLAAGSGDCMDFPVSCGVEQGSNIGIGGGSEPTGTGAPGGGVGQMTSHAVDWDEAASLKESLAWAGEQAGPPTMEELETRIGEYVLPDHWGTQVTEWVRTPTNVEGLPTTPTFTFTSLGKAQGSLPQVIPNTLQLTLGPQGPAAAGYDELRLGVRAMLAATMMWMFAFHVYKVMRSVY